MKKIEFKSNYGNFDYRMTAEIGEEVNAASEALCMEGLANICYRVAGSAVDKALGVKKGEGRKAVGYSDEDGERVNAAVSKKLNEILEKQGVLKPLGLSFAVLGQHEFGAANDTPTKEAVELWTQVQAMVPEEKFNGALKALGLDPEDYEDDEAVLACKRHLQKVKAEAKAKALSALG